MAAVGAEGLMRSVEDVCVGVGAADLVEGDVHGY